MSSKVDENEMQMQNEKVFKSKTELEEQENLRKLNELVMQQEGRNMDYNQNILESFKKFKYEDDEDLEKSVNVVDQRKKTAKNNEIA